MYHDNVYCDFLKKKEGYSMEKFTPLPTKQLLYPFITISPEPLYPNTTTMFLLLVITKTPTRQRNLPLTRENEADAVRNAETRKALVFQRLPDLGCHSYSNCK